VIHNLKIKQCYLSHIAEGKKTFEIRKNDRDFQVGDIIKFLPLEDESYNAKEYGFKYQSYKITYVHCGFGMENEYVCLGISICQ